MSHKSSIEGIRDPRAIDERFAHWLARVEQLVGHEVDPVQAHLAFACLEPPYKPLSPEEYAWELTESYSND